MTAVRPTPFDLALGPLADERFPALERAIIEAGHDPRDRDAFLLVREAIEFLREERPEEGLGAGIDEFVAFVHAAFLFWLDGRAVVRIERDGLDRMLRHEPPGTGDLPVRARSYYLQIAPQRVWGEPVDGAAPEPLDGGFVSIKDGQLEVVAVFGLYPGRPGFTVVHARGARPRGLVRLDYSPLFASRLEGGASGLYSLAGTEELLELAFRAQALLGPSGAMPGEQLVTVA